MAKPNDIKYKLFLDSALTETNPFITTEEVIAWITKRNQKVNVSIERIPFIKMNNWFFTKNNEILMHETGKFFTIEGINVKTNYGHVAEWDQPIINQPEIGYLGFITKEFNGILYFLTQAKIEPGNINNVQLSPTLQATRSNYSQVHKGNKPKYLDYFKKRNNSIVLLDQLQSEQGARFLHKRNRNIIIKTEAEVVVDKDFVWLTLGQLKQLCKLDNVVNMDTRTVISGIPFGQYTNADIEKLVKRSSHNALNRDLLVSALLNENALCTNDEIIAWFTNQKCKYDLNIGMKSLAKIRDWHIGKDEIRHVENKYFKVIATRIEISNREVSSWVQPLIQPAQSGIIAFIIKKINGVYHFLVQAKLECGNFDILEMAPTVQCLTGNYRLDENSVPFLNTVLNARQENIIFDTMQSEEGGRFYKEQNRNLLIKVDDDFNVKLPENYCWMTLNQLLSFLKYNNYLNIQARSLISAITFK